MISILKMSLKFILCVLLFTLIQSHIEHHTKQQIQEKIGKTKIMYGATIRIRAAMFNYHLHSHRVNYPRGSGQQSVTGFQGENDYNSLWTIKQPHSQPIKTYYHELKCGDVIRLEHALTKQNLHSEQIYQSMITNGQQVSAFGNAGEGDENDNWILSCSRKNLGQIFYGEDTFELIHENSEKRIKMSRYYEYSYTNWENCPFEGQLEVSAVAKQSKQTEFKIVGGVFFKQLINKAQPHQQENQDL